MRPCGRWPRWSASSPARCSGVGARYEQLLVSGAYPQLAFAGELPGLLSEPQSARGLPAAVIKLAAAGWEPIGLGAIQDLAQERYGPVDLDRSRVRLDPVVQLSLSCPACAGAQFRFLAELDGQRKQMCTEHAEQAGRIIADRLARAPASNPEGWDAIVGGSSMLDAPTFGLPLWLLADLGRASDRDRSGPRSEAQLRCDAGLALELAKRLADQPEAFAQLMVADVLSDVWLIELPMALAAGGLVDEGVAVADALVELDQDNSGMFASDGAVILAEAGRQQRGARPRRAEPRPVPRRRLDTHPRGRRAPSLSPTRHPPSARSATRSQSHERRATRPGSRTPTSASRGYSPTSPDASRTPPLPNGRCTVPTAPPPADHGSRSRSDATTPALPKRTQIQALLRRLTPTPRHHWNAPILLTESLSAPPAMRMQKSAPPRLRACTPLDAKVAHTQKARARSQPHCRVARR